MSTTITIGYLLREAFAHFAEKQSCWHVDDNDFTGAIRTELTQMTQLTTLYLGEYSLVSAFSGPDCYSYVCLVISQMRTGFLVQSPQ